MKADHNFMEELRNRDEEVGVNSESAESFKSKLKSGLSQYKVFSLLSDQKWHCRNCEGKKVASNQYAGGWYNFEGWRTALNATLKQAESQEFV